jgi:hypothetical protein
MARKLAPCGDVEGHRGTCAGNDNMYRQQRADQSAADEAADIATNLLAPPHQPQ